MLQGHGLFLFFKPAPKFENFEDVVSDSKASVGQPFLLAALQSKITESDPIQSPF